MRQLLPTRLYPGRERVGADLTRLAFAPTVKVFNGVDWYWLPSMGRALAFLVRQRPDVLVFQWWSGTVLHSYLLLGAVAKVLKARIVVEFHEVLDTGEANIPWASAYVRATMPLLVRLASGFVVHSEHDRVVLDRRYRLGSRPVATIPLATLPHGPYDQHKAEGADPRREAPASSCNVLYFGVIRPYKGLEDLVAAFEALSPDEVDGFWLTVVGETWEGWTLPGDMIARSKYRHRITFVNRYVTDEEVGGYFATADLVALPYRRSSASGPLHLAMSYGLPTVVSAVGGLTEVAANYEGALLVQPGDPAAILEALRKGCGLRGRRFADPYSWTKTVDRFDKLFSRALHGGGHAS